MGAEALADTGALLAILNPFDPWHSDCNEAFGKFRLPLVTTDAVLTELFHFVGSRRLELGVTWRFLLSGAVRIETIDHAELPNLHRLMTQYSDRPMDFADASLVYLAKRESIFTVFTVDHADFETYRIEGRRRFRIVPYPRP